MTEADARVLLHNWPGVGGLEAWIQRCGWWRAERLGQRGEGDAANRPARLEAARFVRGDKPSGPSHAWPGRSHAHAKMPRHRVCGIAAASPL